MLLFPAGYTVERMIRQAWGGLLSPRPASPFLIHEDFCKDIAVVILGEQLTVCQVPGCKFLQQEKTRAALSPSAKKQIVPFLPSCSSILLSHSTLFVFLSLLTPLFGTRERNGSSHHCSTGIGESKLAGISGREVC